MDWEWSREGRFYTKRKLLMQSADGDVAFFEQRLKADGVWLPARWEVYWFKNGWKTAHFDNQYRAGCSFPNHEHAKAKALFTKLSDPANRAGNEVAVVCGPSGLSMRQRETLDELPHRQI